MAMSTILIASALGLFVAMPVGPLVLCLLAPIAIAGALHAVAQVAEGRDFDIGDLAAGFRRNTGGLVIVGFVCMAGALVIAALVAIIVVGSIGTGIAFTASGSPATGIGIGFGGLALSGLLGFLIGLPLITAAWFAPALVYFHAMPPVAAMKASLAAILKNWLPMTVFGLIVAVLAFFCLIPMGLGFLVLVPVLAGALYSSYKDIFVG